MGSQDARRQEQSDGVRCPARGRRISGEVGEPCSKSTRHVAIRPVPSTRPAAKASTPRPAPRPSTRAHLRIQEPRRIRDKDHLRFVAQQPCLVCGRSPSDPHHLRFTQRRALGRKVSDEFTVPLCRGHHREVHRSGDEAAWWQTAGIDPMVAARALWLQAHPLRSTGDALDSDTPVTTSGTADGRGEVDAAPAHRTTKRMEQTYSKFGLA